MLRKEIISITNKLIAEGKIFEDQRLAKIMEAYKVRKVGISAKYNFTCVLCGKLVGQEDVFVSCRMKGTSHRWKNSRPIHIRCLETEVKG